MVIRAYKADVLCSNPKIVTFSQYKIHVVLIIDPEWVIMKYIGLGVDQEQCCGESLNWHTILKSYILSTYFYLKLVKVDYINYLTVV